MSTQTTNGVYLLIYFPKHKYLKECVLDTIRDLVGKVEKRAKNHELHRK
jgi:hypothetical protein